MTGLTATVAVSGHLQFTSGVAILTVSKYWKATLSHAPPTKKIYSCNYSTGGTVLRASVAFTLLGSILARSTM